MGITGFISCVKTKHDRPMAAEDLYRSPWFVAARGYIERRTDRWYILSAAHGLLWHYNVIAPYESSLNNMSRAGRRDWAWKVKAQMLENSVCRGRAIVLAGVNYRNDLEPFLHDHFDKVDVPMRGLTMGRQLKFLNDSTRNPT